MPPPQRWHARILPRTSVNGLFPFPKFAPPSILRSSTGLASTPRPSSTSARASRSLVPSGKPTLNLRTAWGGGGKLKAEYAAASTKRCTPESYPVSSLSPTSSDDLHLFRTSVCLNSFAMNLPLTATSQHIINHSLNPCCRTPTLFSHPPTPKVPAGHSATSLPIFGPYTPLKI